MTWTRISDDWTDRPAVIEVSRSARLLLLEMYVYSNRLTTDGRIPTSIIARLTDAEDWRADLAELEAVGLAEETSGGRAFLIDWSDQESAEDVLERQAHRADKQRRYRRRKALHERGDHSACSAPYCKAVTRNATGNEDRNVAGTVTPSRPVPSRPPSGDRGHDDAAPADAGRADEDEAGTFDPWTPRGDCEHMPGGRDEHATFPGRIRCKTCRDAVKAAERQQRLTEAAAELARHRDPTSDEGAAS